MLIGVALIRPRTDTVMSGAGGCYTEPEELRPLPVTNCHANILNMQVHLQQPWISYSIHSSNFASFASTKALSSSEFLHVASSFESASFAPSPAQTYPQG